MTHKILTERCKNNFIKEKLAQSCVVQINTKMLKCKINFRLKAFYSFAGFLSQNHIHLTNLHYSPHYKEKF